MRQGGADRSTLASPNVVRSPAARVVRRSLPCLAALLLAACGGPDSTSEAVPASPTAPRPSPTTGSVMIETITHGGPDFTGFDIRIDREVVGTIGGNASRLIGGLAPGGHSVGLDLPSGCRVLHGSNPRTLVVEIGGLERTTFFVGC